MFVLYLLLLLTFASTFELVRDGANWTLLCSKKHAFGYLLVPYSNPLFHVEIYLNISNVQFYF